MAYEKEEPRPDGRKSRNFVKYDLKKIWGQIHRVYLGKGKFTYARDIALWCEEQDGRWYRSEGYDCYYFSSENTAFHFKVRWAGTLDLETTSKAS